MLHLLTVLLLVASSQGITPEAEHTRVLACQAATRFAGDVFEQIQQNPNVQLDGMLPDDAEWFDYIRGYSGTREELMKEVYLKCLGTSV